MQHLCFGPRIRRPFQAADVQGLGWERYVSLDRAHEQSERMPATTIESDATQDDGCQDVELEIHAN